MGDWANDASARFKKEVEAQDAYTKRLGQERDILVQQGPNLWARIRGLLQAEVTEFNANQPKEVLTAPLCNQNKLTIYAKLPGIQRELSVDFHDETHEIEWGAKDSLSELPDKMGRYGMKVSGNTLILVKPSDSQQPSASDAVKEMLNGLMGWM